MDLYSQHQQFYSLIQSLNALPRRIDDDGELNLRREMFRFWLVKNYHDAFLNITNFSRFLFFYFPP